jgi:trehalose 2-sulfotransferase
VPQPSTSATDAGASRFSSGGIILPSRMPSRGYLLCSVERTGSNLLVDALRSTGLAGRPAEYFNVVEQKSAWMREILQDSTLVEGLPKVLAAGTSPNGVFGAKVHWNHLRNLGMSIEGEWSEAQRVTPYELLRSLLPKVLPEVAARELLESQFSELRSRTTAFAFLRSFMPDLRIVWLKRENMVARAISHFRARQTGVWYLPAANRDTVSPGQDPDFDLAEIHNLYCLGAFQQASWQRFFEEQELSPLCVFYEELAENHESTVRRVLQFLDIPSEQTLIPQPRSAIQSDSLSKEWEERYRRLISEGWS